MPNRGVRLGNFCVNEGLDGNPWLITAEWMQDTNSKPVKPGKVPANNALWLVRFSQ